MAQLIARAYSCDLPQESRLRSSLSRIDYLDSFAVPTSKPAVDIVELYAAALDHLPRAFKYLLVIRSALVRPFGIAGVSFADLTQSIDTKRAYAVGDKLGRWTLYHKGTGELIAGADDKHLDFRVSLIRDGGERVVLSTAVMTHNLFGRAYLTTILPFHRFGVAKLLTRAARAGRL